MSAVRHREAASGRWQEMSLAEQLGNVGSEVSRALRWMGRDARLAEGALERALELLDLTLADPRHLRAPRRLCEIARAREVVVDFLAGRNEYGSTGQSLQRWFDVYAVAARLARGQASCPSDRPAGGEAPRRGTTADPGADPPPEP